MFYFNNMNRKSAKVTLALGSTKNFSEAFPEIKTLKITVNEEMGGAQNGSCTHSYTEKTLLTALDNLGRYRCHNRECNGTGFRICRILSEMVRAKATHNDKEEWRHELCEGENAPHKDCDNSFELEINIEYKLLK